MADYFPPRLPGDLGHLSQTSTNFQNIANTSGQALSELTTSTRQVVWSGLAYDQFSALLSDLPQVLTKVQDSFGSAASALRTYVNALDGLTAEYTSAIYRYNELSGQLEQTVCRSSAALSAGHDVSSFQRQSQSLQDELAPLARQLERCLQAAAQAASDLQWRLEDASSAGIRDDFWNTVGRYGGDVGGFLGDMVTGIAKAVEDLVKSIVNLEEMWVKMQFDLLTGNWAALKADSEQALTDINNIARDLNNVLGTLAPILQLIPGVGEVVDVALLAAAIALVATDVVMMETGVGDKHWGDLGWDGLNAIINVGGAVEDGAVKGLLANSGSKAKILIGADRGHVTQSLDAGIKDLLRGDDVGAEVHVSVARDFADRAMAGEHLISLPERPAIQSLSDVRNVAQIAQSNVDIGFQQIHDLTIMNPTIISSHGLNITFSQWRVADAAMKGLQTGHDALGLAQQPSSDYGATAGDVVSDLSDL